ncbi:MAG: hypothetical protein WCT01_00805 [Candidatus Shapirobacteria bacterium]
MKQIAKQWWQGIKTIGTETVEIAKKETFKMADGVITGKDWLGNIQAMDTNDYNKAKQADEEAKNREIEQIKQQIMGRNVGQEIEEVRKNKTQEEEEQERFLEQLRQQRLAELAEQQSLWTNFGESSNPAKRKKSRGSAFKTGKQGKASQADMSETGEFKGGKID